MSGFSVRGHEILWKDRKCDSTPHLIILNIRNVIEYVASVKHTITSYR